MELFWKRPAPPEPDLHEKRTYFEVYGDYLGINQTLRRMCLGLVLSNIFLIILLKRGEERPPLVIRVNEVGQAEPIRNMNASSQLSKPETLNFVRLFMKFYLERNIYTWKDDLEEAGLMMTPELKGRINKETNFAQETLAVETNRLVSKLKFSDIEVSRETQGAVLVTLKGWRQITSYDDPHYLKEMVFEAELGLRKVARTVETPYGLLVDSYKQVNFKNE